jgi:Uma2 family endonuclease
MSDIVTELKLRPFSVDDYHRAIETGIIDENERVELVNGRLIEMPPLGPWHISIHAMINEYLVTSFGRQLTVVPAGAYPVDRYSEPQPDFMLFSKVSLPFAKLPPIEDVIAFVELSDSTRSFDLGEKALLYARGDIVQYLVVDRSADAIIDHTNPTSSGYDVRRVCHRGEKIPLVAVPSVELEVARMLGPNAAS